MLSRRILPRYNSYSYSAWFPRIMTSRERRLMLLHIAAGVEHPDVGGPRYPGWTNWGPTSLRINCEGGLARNDSDLKYLVRRGYLEFERSEGRQGRFIKTPIRLTYAIITDAGREALKLGKL